MGLVPPKTESVDAVAIICGFGRVGSAVGAALESFGLSYAVIERDPDIIGMLRSRNITAVYGDASHAELLVRAGAAGTSVVIMGFQKLSQPGSRSSASVESMPRFLFWLALTVEKKPNISWQSGPAK